MTQLNWSMCWGDNSWDKHNRRTYHSERLHWGAIIGCGIQESGEISLGDNTNGQTTPPSGIYWDIVSGGDHSCAVDFSGVISCWGSNASGESTPPTNIIHPDFPLYEDEDGDGLLSYQDCDDNDANSLGRADDFDCDGIVSTDDCDDRDDTLLAIAEDADCDRLLVDDDCNDQDATMPNQDADCDGTFTEDDCDDTDANSLRLYRMTQTVMVLPLPMTAMTTTLHYCLPLMMRIVMGTLRRMIVMIQMLCLPMHCWMQTVME